MTGIIAAVKQPTPAEVKAARLEAGLSRDEAAELVHASYRTWQNWELPPSSEESRPIPLASWDLFLIKTKSLRKGKK